MSGDNVLSNLQRTSMSLEEWDKANYRKFRRDIKEAKKSLEEL